MVKVVRRVIGMKVVCSHCRTVLNFQEEDLRYCDFPKKDIYGFDAQYQCIDCPVCGKEVKVRDAKHERWENNVDMIYEKNRNNNG